MGLARCRQSFCFARALYDSLNILFIIEGMKAKLLRLLSFASVTLLALSSSSCRADSKLDGIHAPIVASSDKTPTELDTTWSRLYFGHYPGKEIVASSFSSVASYAYEEKDIKLDASLYEKLSSADWKQDKATIDGVCYERLLEPSSASSAQHYAYDDPGKKYHYFECEPILWRVLSKEGSKVTLMADKALDCLTYHPNDSGANWSKSYVRSYLNSLDGKQNQTGIFFVGGGFLDKAFSEKEKKALLSHDSDTSINRDYDTSTGDKCSDYVYLLDQDELFASDKAAQYGFFHGRGHDDPAKRFKSTMYAKFKGCWFSPVTGYRGNCFHFMRTPGYRNSYTSYICDFGYIYSRGTSSDCFDAGIIPVINVDLSLADWSIESERHSSSMMQVSLQAGEDDSEEGKEKWETIFYGEYPQSEIGNDDSRYAALNQATWVADETEIEGTRYCKVDDRYFEYQPISWRILEKEADSALLFASIGLDCHPFNDKLNNVTWADSSVRRFLNEEFFDKAFPDGGEAILDGELDNIPNYYFGTECGADTKDKVFLLQEKDVFGEEASEKHGFAPSDAANDEGRRIVPSDYAKAKGAWISKDGNGFYSLRTSGYSNANAVYVGELGDIYNRGIPVTCPDMTLVPAIWVDLSLIPPHVV